MHTLATDFCLLLLNLEMSIIISKWGFIWKYKRLYGRKTDNIAAINQIILKTPTRGFSTKVLQMNWKSLVQTPLGTQPDLATQPHYEAPSDLRVKFWIKAVINPGWGTLSPLSANDPKVGRETAK